MAKYVSSLVALVLGAHYRPVSLEQFWVWIRNYLPGGKKFIYRASQRSARGFGLQEMEFASRKKMIRSPTEIICSAYLFLSYWASLQKQEDREQLEERVQKFSRIRRCASILKKEGFLGWNSFNMDEDSALRISSEAQLSFLFVM